MDIDFPENEANGKDFDFPTDEKELAALGIFTPIEKRYYKKQPYWVVPNQKILVVHPSILPQELVGYKAKEEKKTDTNNHRSKLGLSLLARLLRAILIFFFPKRWPKPLPTPKFEKDKQGYTFQAYFKKKKKRAVTLRIVRVCECPNDASEFGGRPSISILVEWDIKRFNSPPGSIRSFNGLWDQSDNLFLINHETNNKPGYPPKASGVITHVYDSDFKKFDDSDKTYYEAIARNNSKKPIVAVVDTGLVYKWESIDGSKGRKYTRDGQEIDFMIANAHSDRCLPEADFGYCGITDYLQSRPFPAHITQLKEVERLSIDDTLMSPYDDNLVDEDVDGVLNERTGRHGTIISALINQAECQVLPVKVFNCAGMGTLFDVLCGFNYVLSRKRSGVPIKVLNASFAGTLNAYGRDLLYRKIRAITNVHGIWVVASAGNQRWSLDKYPLYPAQFSLPHFGLEKVITVTSSYSIGGRQGNFGSPVSIMAKSPLPDGFPSALPTQDDSSLKGTSFAAPFVSLVLAKASSVSIPTRSAALDHLRATRVPRPFPRPAAPGTSPVPEEITFVDPTP